MDRGEYPSRAYERCKDQISQTKTSSPASYSRPRARGPTFSPTSRGDGLLSDLRLLCLQAASSSADFPSQSCLSLKQILGLGWGRECEVKPVLGTTVPGVVYRRTFLTGSQLVVEWHDEITVLLF